MGDILVYRKQKKIMKALITAGGHGTRLRPITHTMNKHLIPLANKPMIFYSLEKIADAGIKEVYININPGEKELPQVVGSGKNWGLKIKYLEQSGGPKGLAHILKIAKPYLKNDSFIFYLGDNIVLSPIRNFIERFNNEKRDGFLTLSKVSDPQRFGVPKLKNGKIVRVEEKPKNPESDFAVTGIYIYNPNVFKALEHIKPSARGELEISDVHTWLIKNGYNLGYEEITGWWKDTGKPEDLLDGNRLILKQYKDWTVLGNIAKGVKIKGDVSIGINSKILEKTKIVGPAIIGNNCRIQNCFLGPNVSIGDNTEIANTSIENSIIFGNSFIRSDGRKIINSLIGEGAQISPSLKKPSAHKLIIGKDSRIDI